MRNTLLAGLLALALVGAGCSSSSQAGTDAQSSNQQNSTTEYTMADVEAANTQAKCWTAINGNVYDLTNWVSQHPGGPENILSLCGKDGSTAFNAQHGGQRRPERTLATFQIGVLRTPS